MKKISFLIMLALITTFFISGCQTISDDRDFNENEKLHVFTTVYPLTYFTQRIGGDYVEVKSIYPPGADEHTFEPTQQDILSIAKSDVFFSIGLGLESFLPNVKKTLQDEKVSFVETSDYLSEEQLSMSTSVEHEHEDGDGHDHHSNVDPHVWLSPTLSIELADAIKDELINQDASHKSDYVSNFEKLKTELQQLDAQYKKVAESASQKSFFVSHASFGYIAGEYGLNQVAIAGLNSQDEPTQKELADLVTLAEKENFHYILFEQNVSSRLTTVIQQEIHARALYLHNLSILTNQDIKNNETYFTLQENNIRTLKTALSSSEFEKE